MIYTQIYFHTRMNPSGFETRDFLLRQAKYFKYLNFIALFIHFTIKNCKRNILYRIILLMLDLLITENVYEWQILRSLLASVGFHSFSETSSTQRAVQQVFFSLCMSKDLGAEMAGRLIRTGCFILVVRVSFKTTTNENP